MYSQKNLRWRWRQLGNCKGTTIGRSGCLLTVMAQLLTNHGYGFNPIQLNEFMRLTNTFVSGCLIPDVALATLFKGKIELVGRVTSPATLSLLECEPGEEIILKVDYNNDPKDGEQRHFVLMKSWDGHDTVTIADPLGGWVGNFKDRYGDPKQNIIAIIKYAFKE